MQEKAYYFFQKIQMTLVHKSYQMLDFLFCARLNQVFKQSLVVVNKRNKSNIGMSFV